MSDANLPKGIRMKSIFHPSDFSVASEVAFTHALKIALVARTKLTMLHVEASPNAEWQDFPGVRDTLERWRLIPKGSPKSAVVQLGIEVDKVIASSNDPVKTCLGLLKKHPGDLIVLAVRQYEGRYGGGQGDTTTDAMIEAAYRSLSPAPAAQKALR